MGKMNTECTFIPIDNLNCMHRHYEALSRAKYDITAGFGTIESIDTGTERYGPRRKILPSGPSNYAQ